MMKRLSIASVALLIAFGLTACHMEEQHLDDSPGRLIDRSNFDSGERLIDRSSIDGSDRLIDQSLYNSGGGSRLIDPSKYQNGGNRLIDRSAY